MKISSFIICKNEELVIERALESLVWSDEIIVVDGESTDNTVEIVRRYTDKIFSRPWTHFGEQRNFALSQLQHPWVFYLDADEICSSELTEWMKSFQKKGPEIFLESTQVSLSSHPLGGPHTSAIDLIEIRRWEHFQGRLYRYGANNPSYQWRFFKREGTQFAGEIHEYPVVQGSIRRLEKPILHFPRVTLEGMVDKMNRYTSMEAEQMSKRGVRRGLSYMFFSGFAMFLKAYFRKQGFRDGILGFILAVMDGGSFFLRQAKLYLKNRQDRST